MKTGMTVFNAMHVMETPAWAQKHFQVSLFTDAIYHAIHQ